MIYRVVDYDVWGNAKTGYWINESYPTHYRVEINPEDNDLDILNALVRIGYLNKDALHMVEIDDTGDEYRIEISIMETEYPICVLVLEGR